MEKQQTAMPIIAGVLVIVSAGFKLLILLSILAASLVVIVPATFTFINPAAIGALIIVPLLAIVVLAIVGGIFCLQRKRWGWALAGSILAILPFSILGLAAVILVALSKDEFK